MTDEEARVIEEACAVVEAFYTQDPGLPTALFLARLDALHAAVLQLEQARKAAEASRG
jgi:hypothetical protein